MSRPPLCSRAAPSSRRHRQSCREVQLPGSFWPFASSSLASESLHTSQGAVRQAMGAHALLPGTIKCRGLSQTQSIRRQRPRAISRAVVRDNANSSLISDEYWGAFACSCQHFHCHYQARTDMNNNYVRNTINTTGIRAVSLRSHSLIVASS